MALDTGELTRKRPLSSNESAKERREQRIKAKKRAMSQGDDASTIGRDDSLHQSFSRIYALKTVADLTSSEEEERRCLDALRSLAGLGQWSPSD